MSLLSGLGGILTKNLSSVFSATSYPGFAGGTFNPSSSLSSALPNGSSEAASQWLTQTGSIVNGTLQGYAPISAPLPVPRPATLNGGTEKQKDRRLRIKAKTDRAANLIYGPRDPNNILSVLYDTGGVLFPYTPTVTLAYSAEWNPYALSHTNYQTQAYTKSQIQNITISGQFTAQNEEEARYTFAAMHFFRTLTKMYYGENDPLAGTTPPVLSLVGYGNGIFNEVPVVITDFTQDFTNDVDMVEVKFDGGNGNAWIPVLTTLIVSLAVTHDLLRVRKEFKLDDFRTGKLLTQNKGFI